MTARPCSKLHCSKPKYGGASRCFPWSACLSSPRTEAPRTKELPSLLAHFFRQNDQMRTCDSANERSQCVRKGKYLRAVCADVSFHIFPNLSKKREGRAWRQMLVLCKRPNLRIFTHLEGAAFGEEDVRVLSEEGVSECVEDEGARRHETAHRAHLYLQPGKKR